MEQITKYTTKLKIGSLWTTDTNKDVINQSSALYLFRKNCFCESTIDVDNNTITFFDSRDFIQYQLTIIDYLGN
jgi:hypothetical protein